MDINVLRSIITVVSLITFLGVVLWAYSAKRNTGFEQAARLPFEDDDASTGEALR